MTSKSLAVRKLADRSDGERVKRYDPETGVSFLADPTTGEPRPWPLAGVQIEGDAPPETRVSTSWVAQAVAEGWVTLENEKPVHRPGGPPADPWRITHTFRQADAVIIHTVSGDVRYRVVGQPDKYVAGNLTADVTDAVYAAGDTEVRWFYDLKLEG